jgi:hypothetical protein
MQVLFMLNVVLLSASMVSAVYAQSHHSWVALILIVIHAGSLYTECYNAECHYGYFRLC